MTREKLCNLDRAAARTPRETVMALAHKAFEWLRSGPAPACDRILGAALVRAEPNWAAQIMETLLARQCEASWAAMIQHYQNLPESVREALRANRGLMAAGLAIAVRTPDAASRLNALETLEANPQPCLMYIAANCLRDSDLRIREVSARILHDCAERLSAYDDKTGDQLESDVTDREHIVRALDDALRMFDAHHRADVLEAGLWFAEPLEHRIWSTIGAVRSHAAILATERLPSWNQPRLAAFLLTALKRPAWRDCAAGMLTRWTQPAQTGALLHQSRLLDDPDIRARLATMRRPAWFDQTSERLEELPVAIRREAPRWLIACGLPADVKLTHARRWARSSDARLHRNAVYALTSLAAADGASEVEALVGKDSPLADYARWYMRAIRLHLVPGSRDRSGSEGAPEPPANPETDFAILWQLCRRTDATRRTEWMALIRENASAWRARIRDCFHSPDPRDRILAIQVVSTHELAMQHREAIRELWDDPFEGIRRLAHTLIDSIQDHPAAGEPAPAPANTEEPTHEPTAMRERLRDLLASAAGDADTSVDPDLMSEIRRLMQDVYGADRAMEPAA